MSGEEREEEIGAKRRHEEIGEIVTAEEIDQRLSGSPPLNSDGDTTEQGDPRAKRFCLDVAEETTELYESEDEDDQEETVICPLCEHATSDLVRDLDKLADKLAGRASHAHVASMQLKIFQDRVEPLRYEGRPNIPNITERWLRKHYPECRICPMRSVAQDIRIFEEAGQLLRQSLKDVDDEGTTVLSSRAASELCRLSKAKTDALKFFHQLNKDREIKEANGKKS